MAMPPSGALDRRVVIRRAAAVRDQYGQQIKTWSDAATVWAAIEWIKDGERWRAGERGVDVAARLTLRWKAGVVASQDRVVIDGDEYEVVGLKEIGRRRALEVTVAKVG